MTETANAVRSMADRKEVVPDEPPAENLKLTLDNHDGTALKRFHDTIVAIF